MPACWCGCDRLEAFSLGHMRCPACETLISLQASTPGIYSRVGNDESGFYGQSYWRNHVTEQLGQPCLEDRARSDLNERAAFWLGRILQLAAPPASVLELGCAPGALVYLLRRAGFAAEGLEMSPAIISVIREKFGVPVHRGPLEEAGLSNTWTVVAAMDVIEHLVAPLDTVRGCVEALRPDGLIVLQTPCYRDQGPEWEMLIPEHLHLFTESSITRLLSAAGLTEVRVEPALFPYDMWVVASRAGPIPTRLDPMAGLDPLLVALVDGIAIRNRMQRDIDWSEKVRRDAEAEVERLVRAVCVPPPESATPSTGGLRHALRRLLRSIRRGRQS